VVKKNSYQGTADYADETDGADEEKPQMNGNPISGNLRTSVFICG
jgi:hypothetical protein